MAPSSHLFFLYCFVSISLSCGMQLIFVNNCNENVWLGTMGSAGQPNPGDGGFHLGIGEEVVLDVLDGQWPGRPWGSDNLVGNPGKPLGKGVIRNPWGSQGCFFDTKGKVNCDKTGDCIGVLHCKGAPPATVVEMTFGKAKRHLITFCPPTR